jgi:hypothetical protein
MEAERSDECEMLVRGEWIRISLDDALSKYDASRTKRCVECHGQVRAHREGSDGMRAHFEHFERHDGCSLGVSFSGIRSMHRKPLE